MLRSVTTRCTLCGYPESSGIHLPALDGPRKGLPYGHAFTAIKSPPAPKPAPPKPQPKPPVRRKRDEYTAQAMAYVATERKKDYGRQATWFDVAAAYDAGLYSALANRTAARRAMEGAA